MVQAGSYLFVTWEGGGNVPAVLGVARRLAARGHDVRVLTEPCLEGAVTAAGARFVPFASHFTRTDGSVPLLDDYRARSPLAALDNTLRSVMFGPAAAVAEETLSAISAEDTQVVVADYLMPGALVAAEAARVPRVVLWHSPEYLPGRGRPAAGPGFVPRSGPLGRVRDQLFNGLFLRVVAPYKDLYNAVRVRHGLRPLTDARDMLAEYHRADLRLIQTARAFDFPLDPAPGNVRYVGPVLDDPHWVATGDPASDQPEDRPLVVASLSSTFQDQAPVLRHVAEGLGRLPVRGLVSTGPALNGGIGPVPANVTLVPSVSHAAVFPRAAAVVTHAGHGTVMRALAAGLPLVCLPMGRDQDDNAAKVAYHGAGLRLRRSATPAAIAAAVERLLGDPSFREAARRIGARIRAEAAEDRAVVELEALARARPPHDEPRAEQGVAADPSVVQLGQ